MVAEEVPHQQVPMRMNVSSAALALCAVTP